MATFATMTALPGEGQAEAWVTWGSREREGSGSGDPKRTLLSFSLGVSVLQPPFLLALFSFLSFCYFYFLEPTEEEENLLGQRDCQMSGWNAGEKG